MFKGVAHCSICGEEFTGRNAGKTLAALRAHRKERHPSARSRPARKTVKAGKDAPLIESLNELAESLKKTVKILKTVKAVKTGKARSKVHKKREDSRGFFD